MALSQKDTEHVIQRLRVGVVPARGLEAFAVGIDRERDEIRRLLDYVGNNEGQVKFLRGDYGCGKTFTARLAVAEAQRAGFATAFTVVSANDFHFHKFREVYEKVLSSLSTPTCPQGALNDVIDRWIGNVEEMLISAGADPEAEDFDEKVSARFAEELRSRTQGNVPDDFVRVVDAIFRAKQDGEFTIASELISWLSGSRTASVDRSAKAGAGIKGEVTDSIALAFLRGVLEMVKGAGYKGLVIVVDEAETIMRMRSDVRAKSLNGMRQIVDAVGDYPGLLWVFTGTKEFFESRRGIAALPPLYDRIRFHEVNGFASARQPQLQLKPFDAERLREVAMKLREIYPASDRIRFESKLTSEFVDALIDSVTAGFRGDVGVVPRQFLRQLVHQMDLVDEDPAFNPSQALGFEPTSLSEHESEVITGESSFADDDEEIFAAEDIW